MIHHLFKQMEEEASERRETKVKFADQQFSSIEIVPSINSCGGMRDPANHEEIIQFAYGTINALDDMALF